MIVTGNIIESGHLKDQEVNKTIILKGVCDRPTGCED